MRKLLIGIGAIVLVVIVLAIVLPFVISTDMLKAQLIARVDAATGRKLTIAGPVSFSILPHIGIVANQVALSNAPGAATPDMVTLAKLDVQLKLVPLVSGNIEVDRFILRDPVIELETAADGTPNWSFRAAQTPAPVTPAAPASTSSARGGVTLAALSLQDVELDNGTVTYLDRRTGKKQVISAIGMTLSLAGLDSPLTAKGGFAWNGQTVKLELGATRPRALISGGSTDLDFAVDSAPITVTFKGQGQGPTPLHLAGDVDLAVPSVRALGAWTGTPINAPGSGFGPLHITGKLDYGPGKIGFSNAALSFDAIKGQGEVALTTGHALPILTGRLAVEQLDVNPYLAPAPGGPTSAAAAPAVPAGRQPASSTGGGWSDAPIDAGALKAADADLALSAQGIRYRAIQIGASALAIHLHGGRMTAELQKLALYGGSGTGTLALDGSGAGLGIDAAVTLSGVQVAPLLHDAAKLDKVTGTANIHTTLSGRGGSQRAIVASLGGNGGVGLTNGTIKGVDLLTMLQGAAKGIGVQSPAGGVTNISRLTGSFTIRNGILSNQDLQMDLAGLSVTGAGTVDLPDRTVDYELTPPRIGRIPAIPVKVSGSWDNLSYRPDIGGLMKNPAAALGALKGLRGSGSGSSSGSTSNPLGALKGLLGQ